MKTRRSLWLAFALAGGLAAPAHIGIAAAASICEIPREHREHGSGELCGTTVARAGSSTTFDVILRSSTHIDTETLRTELFDITQTTSDAGFALAATDPSAANAVLVGGRLSTGHEFLIGAHPQFGGISYNGARVGTSIRDVSLDPGTYRLSIYAFSGQAELTLRLPGLTGENELEQGVPGRAVLATPIPIADSPNLSTASHASRLEAAGILIHALHVDLAISVSTQMVMCQRINPAPREHACLPQSGADLVNDREPTTGGGVRDVVKTTGLVPADAYGLGYIHTVEGFPESLSRRYSAIWLPIYGGPEPPPISQESTAASSPYRHES